MTTNGRRRGSLTQLTGEQVYQAIYDMHTTNPPILVTRERLASLLGVGLSLVSEHIDKLLEKNRIRRVISGVFEPVTITPDHVVSVTWVPGALRPIKLEITGEDADHCINLTPGDARALVFCLQGFAQYRPPEPKDDPT